MLQSIDRKRSTNFLVDENMLYFCSQILQWYLSHVCFCMLRSHTTKQNAKLTQNIGTTQHCAYILSKWRDIFNNIFQMPNNHISYCSCCCCCSNMKLIYRTGAFLKVSIENSFLFVIFAYKNAIFEANFWPKEFYDRNCKYFWSIFFVNLPCRTFFLEYYI